MKREQALKIMGFAIISKPSESEIQKSYRRLALKFHPDKISFSEGTPKKDIELIQKKSQEKFVNIKAARDFLLSPQGSPNIKVQFPWGFFQAEMRERAAAAQAAQQAFDTEMRRRAAAAQQANRRFIKYRINDKEGKIFHSEAAVIDLVFGNVITKHSGVIKRVYIEATNLTSKELFLFSKNIYNGAKGSFEALIVDRALINGMDYADRKGFLKLSCNYRLKSLRNDININKGNAKDKHFVKQGFVFGLTLVLIMLAATLFLYPSIMLDIFALSSLAISAEIFIKGIMPIGLAFIVMAEPSCSFNQMALFLLSPFILVGASVASISAIQYLSGLHYILLCSFPFVAIVTNLVSYLHPGKFRAEAVKRYFEGKVEGYETSNANEKADEAYCLGLESNSWATYLNSFKPSSPAWQQKDAFSAGLFSATEKDCNLPKNKEELKKYGNS